MQGSISFRPLQRSHFQLLQEWLSAPHVARWWNEQTDLAEIEAKYGPRVDGVEQTHVFLVEQEGRPIGWIQWYLWDDYQHHGRQLGAGRNTVGIDLAIGEVKTTGLGLGPIIIREFVTRFILASSRARAVIADPEQTNLGSLRAFDKAGFKMVKVVQLEGERCKRQVMRLDLR
jgi:aminoglycoside 6'-N-acetyltransferase